MNFRKWEWQRLGYWLPFGLFLWLFWGALKAKGGLIGHDYAHALPRLTLGTAHFWKNGLDIPYYTASLCAGLPYFWDPQNSYYSLPQFLAFFMDPFLASRLAILFFYGLGYVGTVHFLAKVTRVSRPVAHLGGFFFVLNGFSFAHLWVGHLTHHAYLLLPWVALLLYRGPEQGWRASASLALLLLYTLYSGGLHVLFVFGAFGLVMLSGTWFRQDRAKVVKFLALVTAIFFAGSLGKILGAVAYSEVFALGAIDTSATSLFAQIARYFWFIPSHTPLSEPFGRIQFGPWEYVGFVSRLTLLALPVYLLLQWREADTAGRKGLLAASAASALVLLAATGNLFNAYLPVLRSYHNPIKLLGALVPLLLFTAVICVERLYQRFLVERPASASFSFCLFFLAAFGLLLEFSISATFFLAHRTGISYAYAPQARTTLPAVQTVVNAPGEDLKAVREGASNLACYEPLLGYRLEKLQSAVTPGAPAAAVSGGAFNLNHPGCLIFPDHFQCRRWDRIQLSDRENFERFAEGRTPHWSPPAAISALVRLGLLVVALLTLLQLQALFRLFSFQKK